MINSRSDVVKRLKAGDYSLDLSLAHCHVRGLHSIVLDEENRYGGMNRIYFCSEEHELWRNYARHDEWDDHAYEARMSLGVHPHHCGLGIFMLAGGIANLIFKVSDRGQFYKRFRYRSGISDEAAGFVYDGQAQLVKTETRWLRLGTARPYDEMDAEELHTVAVLHGDFAAWLIVERQEDPNYENVCYSNADLERFDASGLYQPMTEDLVADLVKRIS